jgi:hypothetical protein
VYFFPILVPCTKKNLANLRRSRTVVAARGGNGVTRIKRKSFERRMTNQAAAENCRGKRGGNHS